MNVRVLSSVVLPAVAFAMAITVASEAFARPGDRMAARRLQRLLPPGSMVVVPRPDEVPVVPPMSPRQARRLARRGEPLIVQPPAPTVVVKPTTPLVTAPASVMPPMPANVPLAAPPATVVAPAPPLVRPAVPATPATPAPPVVVDRAGGPVPPAPPAAQTGAWTLAPEAAADGTQSVLVPGNPAEPVELLPTPAPAPAPR